jgi:hypothetical protein
LFRKNPQDKITKDRSQPALSTVAIHG